MFFNLESAINVHTPRINLGAQSTSRRVGKVTIFTQCSTVDKEGGLNIRASTFSGRFNDVCKKANRALLEYAQDSIKAFCGD